MLKKHWELVLTSAYYNNAQFHSSALKLWTYLQSTRVGIPSELLGEECVKQYEFFENVSVQGGPFSNRTEGPSVNKEYGMKNHKINRQSRIRKIPENTNAETISYVFRGGKRKTKKRKEQGKNAENVFATLPQVGWRPRHGISLLL